MLLAELGHHGGRLAAPALAGDEVVGDGRSGSDDRPAGRDDERPVVVEEHVAVAELAHEGDGLSRQRAALRRSLRHDGFPLPPGVG